MRQGLSPQLENAHVGSLHTFFPVKLSRSLQVEIGELKNDRLTLATRLYCGRTDGVVEASERSPQVLSTGGVRTSFCG